MPMSKFGPDKPLTAEPMTVIYAKIPVSTQSILAIQAAKDQRQNTFIYRQALVAAAEGFAKEFTSTEKALLAKVRDAKSTPKKGGK